jgi:hypothetical protein
VSERSTARERLGFLADVVTREATHLQQTDSRLFGPGFGIEQARGLAGDPELSERVDAFVARFGRLQDTLAAALLPRLLELLLEPTGSVLDNLGRAERLGWIRSASDWAEWRLLRNRMVHEYVRDPQALLDALQAAHAAVADLCTAAAAMTRRAEDIVAPRAG